jgi:hypothetical protein
MSLVKLINGTMMFQKRSMMVLFAFILCLTSGYSKEQEFNYLKNGISFTLPGSWRTISDEVLPGKGYYFSSESSGKNSSGLFSLVTINTMENPVKALLLQQTNMKEEPIYKDNGIEFTEITEGRFGSMSTRTVTYEAVVKGTKVSGTIHCFNCSEKTYLLFFQTGIKDQKINAKVFRMIELTFACR